MLKCSKCGRTTHAYDCIYYVENGKYICLDCYNQQLQIYKDEYAIAQKLNVLYPICTTDKWMEIIKELIYLYTLHPKFDLTFIFLVIQTITNLYSNKTC